MSNFLDGTVIKALQKSFLAALAASDFPDTPVKMLGRTFTPPDDGTPWFEVLVIPNNPDNQFWGDERTYQGLFRVLLHVSNEDEGVYGDIDRLKSVVQYFTKNREVTEGTITVRITTPPNLTSIEPAGHETVFPVSMRYVYSQP